MITLLSIDALTTSDIPHFLKRKNLGPVIERSFIVPEILAVCPTQTYTCHASMVTGCYPGRHGIVNNTVAFSDSWHWNRSDIQVPVITDFLKKAGLVTASCAFPCLGGSDIDYLIPEIWTEHPEDNPDDVFLAATSPKALPFYHRNKDKLDWMRTPGFDLFATSCFIDIAREAKPDFAMLHLSYLDHQKHRCGNNIEHAYDFIDERIGEIQDALKAEGIENRFIVLGDHGHRPIRKVFNLKKAISDEGYDGKIKAHCACFTAQIYLDGTDIQEAIGVLERIKARCPGSIDRILDRNQMQDMYHLQGGFEILVEGCDGWTFAFDDSPLVSEAASCNISGHGYAPEKGPFSPFIAQDLVHAPVDRMNLVDVAPTVLDLLGITAQGMDGRSIL